MIATNVTAVQMVFATRAVFRSAQCTLIRVIQMFGTAVLSELLLTRMRYNGMSIALLINQAVSTTIAAVFLPSVGRHGYATMFFFFAGCTATFFLPETKGRILEEIEEHFEGKK